MFEIKKNEKTLSKLEACTFGELKIREREDLQEWLANTPDALGEELLIIQKEFAGFEDTKERLDLLAIDKNGALVIIENKLDDTGKDVVWQALKYVAYCSSLKKSDVVQIFQDYLKRHGKSDDASELLCEFLNAGSIDEANINTGFNQRLILVAAKFRKEVTSTIIWLIENGVIAQCMKATPYKFDDKLLLDISKIVPTPEAEEFMIVMSSKKSEEKETRVDQARSGQVRLKFWNGLLDYFEQKNFNLYANVSPSTDHWLNTGPGISGCYYTLIFLRQEIRAEFIMSRSSKEETKILFDYLYERRSEINKRFGEDLDWQRLDDKKTSRIFLAKKIDGYVEENWPEIMEWLLVHMQKIESTFKPLIGDMRNILKN